MSNFIDVYCDFDGTVTNGDTIDYLLEELASPSWRKVEERWEKGEIGSRECMAEQIPLIQGGWLAIEKVLDTVKVDPTFPHFASWCKRNNIALKIVSDGIDKVIHHILKREKIQVANVWANHLLEAADGTLALSFPHAPQIESCGSGLCKCKILSANPMKPLKVVIGDGRSDFCWAAEADLIFAKTKLLTYCQANNIDCVPYEDFTAIRAVLQEKLDNVYVLEPQRIPSLAQA